MRFALADPGCDQWYNPSLIMTLMPGSKLGPYEFGAGGMGEIYRARDPRLNRKS
jgi:hypothetical protein